MPPLNTWSRPQLEADDDLDDLDDLDDQLEADDDRLSFWITHTSNLKRSDAF